MNTGKGTVIKLITQNTSFQTKLSILNNPSAEIQDILSSGREFTRLLYGSKNRDKESLNSLRYRCFIQATSRSKKEVKFESLPPTEDATDQHFNNQLQTWEGRILPPEEWGCKVINGFLLPIPMTLPPAPDHLLNLISCACTKTCTLHREMFLFQVWTKVHEHLGQNCFGLSCSNSAVPMNNEQDEEIETLET